MFNSIEIERVESVSGNSKSSVNPAGKKGSRPLTDSLDESSRRDGGLASQFLMILVTPTLRTRVLILILI